MLYMKAAFAVLQISMRCWHAKYILVANSEPRGRATPLGRVKVTPPNVWMREKGLAKSYHVEISVRLVGSGGHSIRIEPSMPEDDAVHNLAHHKHKEEQT
jgi:hypothetical protein